MFFALSQPFVIDFFSFLNADPSRWVVALLSSAAVGDCLRESFMPAANVFIRGRAAEDGFYSKKCN